MRKASRFPVVAQVAVGIAAIAAIAACTPTPREQAQIAARVASEQQKLDAELAGLSPGKPSTCMDRLNPQQVTSYGATFLYKVSNTRIYRTETTGGCGNLSRDVLVTRTTTGQLCRGDIAQTIDSASRFPTGSCSFGDFVLYTKPR